MESPRRRHDVGLGGLDRHAAPAELGGGRSNHGLELVFQRRVEPQPGGAMIELSGQSDLDAAQHQGTAAAGEGLCELAHPACDLGAIEERRQVVEEADDLALQIDQSFEGPGRIRRALEHSGVFAMQAVRRTPFEERRREIARHLAQQALDARLVGPLDHHQRVARQDEQRELATKVRSRHVSEPGLSRRRSSRRRPRRSRPAVRRRSGTSPPGLACGRPRNWSPSRGRAASDRRRAE